MSGINSFDQAIAEAETATAQAVVAANDAAAAAAYLAMANPAPLNSPHFTGDPTAPTAPQNTNSTQLATTAYLDRLLGAALGLPTLDNTGHVPLSQLPSSVTGGLSFQGAWNANTNTPTIVSGAGTNGYFYIVQTAGSTTIDGNSTWNVGDWILYQGGSSNVWERIQPVYTPVYGIPLANLQAINISSFVGNNLGTPGVPVVFNNVQATAMLAPVTGDSGSGGLQGVVPAPAAGDYAAGKYLDAGGFYSVPPGSVTVGMLASYALLASPALTGTPTAPNQAVDLSSTALATCAFVLGQAASANPIIDGTAAPGTSKRYARADHVHPTDTSRAPVASPTLTGTPAAPTATGGTNTTQIATCAFVTAAISTAGAALAAIYAPLASPTLTGTPAAPTASPGTNTTQLATCAFVEAAVAGITITAGDGISVSGTTVSINTNDANGIGTYALLDVGPSSITSGSTVTAGGVYPFFVDTTDVNRGAVPAGQVWRNMGGYTASSAVPTLFMRVS